MRSSALGVEQRLPVNCETPAGAQEGDYLVGDSLVKSCLKLFRRSQQNGVAYNLILCDAQVFKPVDTGQLLNHLKSQALVR